MGGVDCGLFAIADLVDICYGRDPNMIIYDQSKQEHLKECFEKQRMTGFPRFHVDPSGTRMNKLHESWECELPKKTVKRDAVYRKEPDGCDTVKGIPTSDNKFNFLEEVGNRKGKRDTKNRVYPASIDKKLKEVTKESKLIVNLSSETLTEYERSLLMKGFKFCSYNKVKFVRDITSWFRNLWTREYFPPRLKSEWNKTR